MITYQTTTGMGYFEDAQGRVVDRVAGLRPGTHTAGDPRETFVEVEAFGDLPAVDAAYAGQEPSLGTDIGRKQAFLDAGASALDHRDAMAANANIPPEVVDYADDVLRMIYLLYVQAAGDANRVDAFENQYFP